MTPSRGQPPKGSQTISSFFQRIERPASSSSASASKASINGDSGNAPSTVVGQRRPASTPLPNPAPPKRTRFTTPENTSLASWRYIRPTSTTSQCEDEEAANEDVAADETKEVAMPADVPPADSARHAKFVKLLYATSQSEQQRNYGYLSHQTMRRDHDDGAPGPSASGSSSRFFPSQADAGGGRGANDDDAEVQAMMDDEFSDSEPEIISSLNRFAHGNGAPSSSSKANSQVRSRSGASKSSASSAAPASLKGKGKAMDDGSITYTPLETQILKLKDAYPGVLLIIEVGYKLKFYGDDARIASRELNIACFPEKHLLTAMIPVHRLHVHIRKLIAAGYKVGVVRQTETRALKAVSANKSQPFTRELTAMYTASTWIDDLEAGPGNLAGTDTAVEGGLEEPTALRSVVCILERPEGGSGSDERVSIGLVSVSVSTGDVVYDQFVDGNLRSELETRIAHLNPAELLLPDPYGKAALSRQTEKLLKYIANQSVNRSGRSSVRIERFSEGKLTQNEAVGWLEEFYTRGPPSPPSASTNANGKATDRTASNGKAASSAIRIDHSDDEESASSTTRNAGVSSGTTALPTILKLPHLCLISLAHLIKHLSSFFSLTSVFSQPTNFTSLENRTTMLLTANTIHNLEIFQNSTDGRRKGSLIWLLDRCKTMMGRRLLRRWVARPLTDIGALEARVDAVEELGRPELSVGGRLASMLQGTPDIERGLAKLNYGALTPTELATMLLALNRIAHEFGGSNDAADVSTRSELVNENVGVLPLVKGLVQRAMGAINISEARKGNKKDLFVDPDMYPDIQDAKDNILVMESELREHLKEVRKQLKRPKLDYISVAGNDFLIEVRTADASKVPADWLRISATKSMVRFHTPQVRQLMQERERHIEMLDAAAEAGYKAFLETLKEDYVLLRNVVSAIATLDALLSLVLVSQLPGYCKPIFNENNVTRIEGLRHPMSEQLMGSDFVPNDVVLGDVNSDDKAEHASTILLTGSNMGGKSSTARATALVSVLAQIGSFVPADSACLPIHDAVLTRMGASDMLAKGRSTFMVEVVETAEIMRAATGRSLVIIDELGRGTSTYDGLAIAYAVLEYLVLGDQDGGDGNGDSDGSKVARRPQMFFITHHFQLCDLEGLERYRGLIRNMHMAVLEVEPRSNTVLAEDDAHGPQRSEVLASASSAASEPQIVFLYKLQPGPASKSLGINCARLAGLPETVLRQAAKKSVEMEMLERREVEGRKVGVMAKMLRSLFRPRDGEVQTEDLERLKEALAL